MRGIFLYNFIQARSTMESIGKYRVLSILGRGGSSSVYLVVDERIGKKWAVKVIPGRYIQKDGILLLRELDHPSLPRIVEELEGTNEFYEVTDYFEGVSLDKWAYRGITPGEAMSASLEILESVAYLHSRSVPIIHRDIKPANFIMTSEGKIKLIDFDLAVAGERSGMVPMGTKGYAPPEQYRGVCSMKGDVYALGKTIDFLLNSVDPEKLTLSDRKIFDQVRKICRRAADSVPEKRFDDAGEMMSAFEKCMKIRKLIRPVLSVLIAVSLLSVLLFAGRGILKDAFRADAEQRIHTNFANASSLISEAVDLYSSSSEKEQSAYTVSKAAECAEKAVDYIENSEHLLKELDADAGEELTFQFYRLRHSAKIIEGCTASGESERSDAYRTCISEDTEYEKFLKKREALDDLFLLYRDDAELCRMLGDTGSALRFYEEAMEVPGISREMRATAADLTIGFQKEGSHIENEE